MCAWPMAIERCPAGACSASHGCNGRRAATTSGRRSSARSRAREHLHPAGIVEPQGAHHAVDDLEVVGESLGVGVDDHELGPTEAVDRTVARGVERALRRRAELRERRIGRRLEQQRQVAGRPVERVVRASRVDALEGAPRAVVVALDDEPFALEPGGVRVEPEVDHGLDAVTRPTVGARAVESEPRGRPRCTPRTPRGERCEVFEVGSGRDRQRTAIGMDEREHALPQLTLDALLDQIPVVEHDTRLRRMSAGVCPRRTFSGVSRRRERRRLLGRYGRRALGTTRGRRCRAS